MILVDNIFGFLMIAAVLLISIYTIYLSILMRRKTDRQERAEKARALEPSIEFCLQLG